MLPKRFVFAYLLVACCAPAYLYSAPVPVANEPLLLLVPETSKVAVGDPLLVKVTLSTGSGAAVALPRSFTSSTGTVGFEIARSGETHFTRVRALGEGLSCAMSRGHTVPAKSRIVTYEWLFCSEGIKGLPAAEKLSLRAVVHFRNGEVLKSPPVEVIVSQRTDRALEVFESIKSDLRDSLLAYGALPTSRVDRLTRVAYALGDSNSRSVIARIRVLHALFLTRGTDAYVEVLGYVHSYRTQLSGPAAEHFDLEMARILLKVDRLEPAMAKLRSIPEQSAYKASLMAQYEELKRVHTAKPNPGRLPN